MFRSIENLSAWLSFSEEALIAWCHRWSIVEMAFFGSVLRADFSPQSDVDVMVTFAEGAEWELFQFNAMAEELEALLGRPVDLLTRRGVESSRNALRKREILESAQVVYAA